MVDDVVLLEVIEVFVVEVIGAAIEEILFLVNAVFEVVFLDWL
jgi:hypothetical protein